MAETKIQDIIVPEVFLPYMIQESVAKNKFINSGIAAPRRGVELSKGGSTVTIPMWNDLDDEDEVLSDSKALTDKSFTATADIAAIHARGWSLARNDLAALLAGSDPLKELAGLIAKKWDRIMTNIAVSTLTGAMGSTGMEDSVLDKSGTLLTADLMSDGAFLLGDSFEKIHAVAFSAQVLNKLTKLNLIDTVQPSNVEAPVNYYMGKRVVVDDALVGDGEGNYPIYFFGEGALAYNENSGLATVEHERDARAGIDRIVTRRSFTMHPCGIKWKGTPAGTFPTNEELATSTNWELVDNRKNVAIAQLIAKV